MFSEKENKGIIDELYSAGWRPYNLQGKNLKEILLPGFSLEPVQLLELSKIYKLLPVPVGLQTIQGSITNAVYKKMVPCLNIKINERIGNFPFTDVYLDPNYFSFINAQNGLMFIIDYNDILKNIKGNIKTIELSGLEQKISLIKKNQNIILN